MSRRPFILAISMGLLWLVSQSQTVVAIQPDDPEPSNDPVLLLLSEILQIDPECLSPCWWGFNLGEVSQFEFRHFFYNIMPATEFDADPRVWISQSNINVRGSKPSREFSISFWGEGTIVEKLSISFQKNIIPHNEPPFGYDLTTVMAAYGVPDYVYINPQNDPPPGHIIYLIYRDPFLVVEYWFKPDRDIFHDTDNELYLSCFPIEYMWWFRLIAGDFDFDEQIETYKKPDSIYFALEEISEFTVESFYEATIIDGEHPCISLPAPPPIVP